MFGSVNCKYGGTSRVEHSILGTASMIGLFDGVSCKYEGLHDSVKWK